MEKFKTGSATRGTAPNTPADHLPHAHNQVGSGLGAGVEGGDTIEQVHAPRVGRGVRHRARGPKSGVHVAKIRGHGCRFVQTSNAGVVKLHELLLCGQAPVGVGRTANDGYRAGHGTPCFAKLVAVIDSIGPSISGRGNLSHHEPRHQLFVNAMLVGGVATIGCVRAVGATGFNSWSQVLPIAIGVVCYRSVGSCVACVGAASGVNATAFVIVCDGHSAAPNEHRPRWNASWKANNVIIVVVNGVEEIETGNARGCGVVKNPCARLVAAMRLALACEPSKSQHRATAVACFANVPAGKISRFCGLNCTARGYNTTYAAIC